jgi:hypothetical protein
MVVPPGMQSASTYPGAALAAGGNQASSSRGLSGIGGSSGSGAGAPGGHSTPNTGALPDPHGRAGLQTTGSAAVRYPSENRKHALEGYMNRAGSAPDVGSVAQQQLLREANGSGSRGRVPSGGPAGGNFGMVGAMSDPHAMASATAADSTYRTFKELLSEAQPQLRLLVWRREILHFALHRRFYGVSIFLRPRKIAL